MEPLGFLAIWRAATFRPRAFFALPAEQRAKWPPLKVALACYAIFLLCGGFWSTQLVQHRGVATNLVYAAIFLLFSPLNALGGVYLSALFIKLGLTIVRAPPRPFQETVEVFGYSSAALVLFSIPVLGLIAGVALYLRAVYLGLRVRHGVGGITAALLALALTIASAEFPLAIRRYLWEPFHMPAVSMIPTLLDGDQLLVDKWVYRSAKPRRGDLIVFVSPKSPGSDYLKRVIGIAGDKITFEGNEVLVNGMPLRVPGETQSCDYLDHSMFDGTVTPTKCESNLEQLDGFSYRVGHTGQHGFAGAPFEVPPGTVYVLGDNRERSLDSREFGAVPLASIKGRVSLVWLSIDEHRPRWERMWLSIPHP